MEVEALSRLFGAEVERLTREDLGFRLPTVQPVSHSTDSKVAAVTVSPPRAGDFDEVVDGLLVVW